MRTLLAVSLLAAVALVAPAQEAPDNAAAAKAVIAKAIAAHGGAEALKAFANTSSSATGTMTVLGAEMPFTSEVVFAAPDKLRMTMKTEIAGVKTEMVQVMNGDKFRLTMNGKATEIGAVEKGELKQAAMMQDIVLLAPLLGAKYTLKAEKDDKVGDAEVSVVSVAAKDFKPATLSFDKKTGYLVRHVRKGFAPTLKGPTEVTEETRMGEFQKFDGVMLPTKMTATHDGKPFMTMTVTAGKALKAVDEKLFTIGD